MESVIHGPTEQRLWETYRQRFITAKAWSVTLLDYYFNES